MNVSPLGMGLWKSNVSFRKGELIPNLTHQGLTSPQFELEKFRKSIEAAKTIKEGDYAKAIRLCEGLSDNTLIQILKYHIKQLNKQIHK